VYTPPLTVHWSIVGVPLELNKPVGNILCSFVHYSNQVAANGTVAVAHERYSSSLGTSATSSTDSVDVFGNVFGHIVVEDDIDFGYIDSTTHEISGD